MVVCTRSAGAGFGTHEHPARHSIWHGVVYMHLGIWGGLMREQLVGGATFDDWHQVCLHHLYDGMRG